MRKNSFIGLDVGGTKIFGARFDESEQIEAKIQIPTAAAQGKETVLKNIKDTISELLTPEIDAIGIAWPGFVNATEGKVLRTPHIPGFENFELTTCLSDHFALPVFLENDARLFTLAEALEGGGKDLPYVLGIVLGTGVGSGLVLEGEIYHGQDCFAGEVAHTILDFSTGESGEDLLSGPNLIRRFEAAGLEADFPAHLATWQKKSGSAFEIFEKWLSDLATLLTNLTYALNPSVITFGGSIGRYVLPLLLPALNEKISEFLQRRNIPLKTCLKISELENSGALGAALLAKQKVSS